MNFKNDRGEILTSLLDENTERFNSVKPNEEMTFSVRVIKTNEIKKGEESYEFNVKKKLVGDNVEQYITKDGLHKNLILVNDNQSDVLEKKIVSILGNDIKRGSPILMTIICDDDENIEVIANISIDFNWIFAEWYDNYKYYCMIGEYDNGSTSAKEDFLNAVN